MNHEFGNVNEEFLIEEISGKSEYILSTLSLLINQVSIIKYYLISEI